MKVIKCAQSDKPNSEKYLLTEGDRQIGYGYIIERETNPIEIFVTKEMRSNGYGKFLFNNLIQIEKERDKKVLLFEVDRENYRLTNIISSLGAHRIESGEKSIRLALPLK